MKGSILDFSIQHNTGFISGDDNQRYSFNGADWRSERPPSRGYRVDFIVNVAGEASEVYLALGSSIYLGEKISTQLGKYSNLDQAEENYSSIDWFVKCLTNYANFSGRARRKEFWFFMLFCVILGIIAEVIDTVLGTKPLVNSLLNLVLLVPSLAVGARRLHDVGRSGWWQLLTLTVIGILVLIWWWATETKQQNNEYGAPAK
ncbi:DUF805 domain-containing protein [Acinetobacter lwoffii]|uniref:DUF805 domain-containing protein n=1 Tax=Acinetobacter lwoffii TaxID=28090 RepID=A0AAW8AVS8_ACILW|nr:DUF805 domain-containing protein [Acinetobacter lwoffii]MDP1371643.1 DUF805 domain-containing protein [Acinetobacter lwoffii]MDP1391085.1 DUF805 domain-containing protein [Acinetobacter lwoffii]MDP1448764.1 DUF805 domain-containing protein [Acinetobacter lwoffii]